MVADSDDVEKHLSPEQLAQWRSERKVEDDPRVTRVGRFLRKTSLASVIIGTPGDGESTKSLSRSANSSLDLQLCERRPGLCCFARTQYKRFQFLSVVVFSGCSRCFQPYVHSHFITCSLRSITGLRRGVFFFPLHFEGGEMQ